MILSINDIKYAIIFLVLSIFMTSSPGEHDEASVYQPTISSNNNCVTYDMYTDGWKTAFELKPVNAIPEEWFKNLIDGNTITDMKRLSKNRGYLVYHRYGVGPTIAEKLDKRIAATCKPGN